jgi:hypothetical protein
MSGQEQTFHRRPVGQSARTNLLGRGSPTVHWSDAVQRVRLLAFLRKSIDKGHMIAQAG